MILTSTRLKEDRESKEQPNLDRLILPFLLGVREQGNI